MIGGRPRAAHYFLGSTATGKLLYLDPHTVQTALRRDAPDLASCHFKAPIVPSMPLLQLDPSLALGFLCRSRDDFSSLCSAFEALFATCLPPFSVARMRPNFDVIDSLSERASGVSDGPPNDDEEGVLL